jgi:ribosomal protein S18 acetylase RimI-like enzyme
MPVEGAPVVRRLRPDEVDLLRRVRLRALLEEPAAFCSTYEGEAAFSDDVWSWRLRPDGFPQLVCGVPGEEPVGLLTVGRADADVRTAELFGMWVDPAARGTGVADALVAAAVECAVAAGCATVRLQVIDGNARAEGCYRRHGFRRTGSVSVLADGRVEVDMERALAL